MLHAAYTCPSTSADQVMQRMTRGCCNPGKENACTPDAISLSISEDTRPCEKLPEQSFVILLVFYWLRHEQEIKIVDSFSLSAYTIMDYIFHLTIKICYHMINAMCSGCTRRQGAQSFRVNFQLRVRVSSSGTYYRESNPSKMTDANLKLSTADVCI